MHSRCLDEQYSSWARILLGSDPWRNPVLCQLELGWGLSGFARAVQAVARRRAFLLGLPNADLHGWIFKQATSFPNSWACRSRLLLEDWGLHDWRECDPTESLSDYKQYVRHVLLMQCKQRQLDEIRRHTAPFPYSAVNADESPSQTLRSLLCSPVDWNTLVASRSYCRMRIGLLRLASREGRRSAAQVQQCIWCGIDLILPLEPYDHVLCHCPHWHAMRQAVHSCDVRPVQATSWLALRPADPGFEAVLALVLAIDRSAADLWETE